MPRLSRVLETLESFRRCRSEAAYLRLWSPQFALRRIVAGVKQGGHSIPPSGMLRRNSNLTPKTKRHYII